MNKEELVRKLKNINNRLDEMRSEWKVASPGMKKFIESSAKIRNEERDSIIRQLGNF